MNGFVQLFGLWIIAQVTRLAGQAAEVQASHCTVCHLGERIENLGIHHAAPYSKLSDVGAATSEQ